MFKVLLTLFVITAPTMAFNFDLNSYCPEEMSTEQCAISIYDQFEDADTKLNQVYNQIMSGSKLTPADKTRLRKAELSWILFKDNYCDLMINAKTTTDRLVYNIVIHSCELELTEKHTKRLEQLL